MLRAALPKADVAPRITRVWSLAISKLRCRHDQAVAYDSGIAAKSSHERSVVLLSAHIATEGAVRPMSTQPQRTCPTCDNELSGAMEFCPVCMLRKGLACGVESGESTFEAFSH